MVLEKTKLYNIEVTILGVAGITGTRHPPSDLNHFTKPSLPEVHKAVVVCSYNSETLGVTPVSTPLQQTLRREGDDAYIGCDERYIALWRHGKPSSPSISFDVELPDLNRLQFDANTYIASSRLLNKDIQLVVEMQSGDDLSTVPIGAASLPLRCGMRSGTYDLPIYSIQNHQDSILPFAGGLLEKHEEEKKEDTPWPNVDPLRGAFGIDPTDSLLRAEVNIFPLKETDPILSKMRRKNQRYQRKLHTDTVTRKQCGVSKQTPLNACKTAEQSSYKVADENTIEREYEDEMGEVLYILPPLSEDDDDEETDDDDDETLYSETTTASNDTFRFLEERLKGIAAFVEMIPLPECTPVYCFTEPDKDGDTRDETVDETFEESYNGSHGVRCSKEGTHNTTSNGLKSFSFWNREDVQTDDEVTALVNSADHETAKQDDHSKTESDELDLPMMLNTYTQRVDGIHRDNAFSTAKGLKRPTTQVMSSLDATDNPRMQKNPIVVSKDGVKTDYTCFCLSTDSPSRAPETKLTAEKIYRKGVFSCLAAGSEDFVKSTKKWTDQNIGDANNQDSAKGMAAIEELLDGEHAPSFLQIVRNMLTLLDEAMTTTPIVKPPTIIQPTIRSDESIGELTTTTHEREIERMEQQHKKVVRMFSCGAEQVLADNDMTFDTNESFPLKK
jgi:hypothetical protein